VVRRALTADCDRLRDLIETSARASTSTHYSADEIAGALEAGIWGVDRALVRDGTCYLVEVLGEVVATGSWSRAKTLFGSDAMSNRSDETLDPATDGARLRAFFVHPEYSGRGFGTVLLRKCEREAVRAGFRRLELVATLSGEGFYKSHGFVALEPVPALLPSGGALTFVRMAKHLGSAEMKAR
jgi:GNAT superfamily N-acetyltransferase